MVLLVIFLTRRVAIVVAIMPYTLYSKLNQSSRLKMIENRAIGRNRIVKRRDNRAEIQKLLLDEFVAPRQSWRVPQAMKQGVR